MEYRVKQLNLETQRLPFINASHLWMHKRHTCVGLLNSEERFWQALDFLFDQTSSESSSEREDTTEISEELSSSSSKEEVLSDESDEDPLE